MDKNAFCNSCPYMELDVQNLSQGVCHANPPTAQAIGPGQVLGILPPVQGNTSWCSKHPQRRPDES